MKIIEIESPTTPIRLPRDTAEHHRHRAHRPATRVWRRAVAVGVALLVMAGAGVAGLWWTHAHPSAAPVAVSERPASAPMPIAVPGPSPRTTPASSPGSATSSLARYAGHWQSHGVGITFDASGRGRMDFRTYTPCTDPEPGVACEHHVPENAGRATVALEDGVGGLRFRVLSTNDRKDYPVGRTQPVRVVRAGILEIGTGDDSWGLCRSPAYDAICGA